MALTFTTIQHEFRKKQGLSLLEYTLCDMVYFLSTKPKSASPGWCYMSKQVMAQELGISKRGVLKLLERLLEEGFLVKNEETKFIKTTEKWDSVYVSVGGEQSAPVVNKVHSSGEQSSPDAGEQSAPNNNIIDNTKIKNAEAVFGSLLEQSFEVFSKAGLKGVFFQKMKQLYGLNDVEVNSYFKAWKKEKSTVEAEFRTEQHLKNSFNLFIKKSKSSGGRTVLDTPVRVSGGRLIG